MRVLPEDWAIDIFRDDLVYLEASLLADERTEDLAPAVGAAIAELEAVSKGGPAVQRAVVQASARAARADANLDDCLRSAHSALLAEARQDRSHPVFRAVWPAPIHEVVRHALQRQVDVAQKIADKLSLSPVPDAIRDKHRPLLESAIARGQAALAARRDAELARMHHRVDEVAVKQEVNAVRLSVYSALLLRASSSRAAKAWADSFFAATKRSSGEEDAGVSPEPNPPSS